MIIATPLLGQRSLPPYPPWSLCSVSIRSHWGCSSSHFTFLSLSAAAKLLGFLFLWASDITAAFELQQRSAASVPFLLIHLLYTHLLSFFFFLSSWELSFSSWPHEQEKVHQLFRAGVGSSYNACYVSHPQWSTLLGLFHISMLYFR